MPVFFPPDAVLYRARLGPTARQRGASVVCQWLAWTGADASLAHVRIVSSTVPGLPCGRVGLVLRARLVPLRRRTPTPEHARSGGESDGDAPNASHHGHDHSAREGLGAHQRGLPV